MDIDLLWSIGGWFLINLDCMATSLNLKSSSEISSSKSNPNFLLFLALIFILLLLVHSSPAADPSMPSISSKFSTQNTLPIPDSTMMNLHHKRNRQKSRRSEFEAGEHEVPSGPNPISN
ncbi:hypothetical protein M9H77_01215 [Catharanthus roseus]|uniref:Uncharacterized protein n=1 Tax=Catharanthus roseus TaxID=4058 RepID=A0ACC0C4V8_CATRO|nr:hypothetical protein M9H77_01215 [Catharanthus roseus]